MRTAAALLLLGACTAPPGPPALVDVTVARGLPTAAGTCVVFEDLDGDGSPDLVLAHVDVNASPTHLDLYRGAHGPGERIPFGPGEIGRCWPVDVDADGKRDLLVQQQDGQMRRLRYLHAEGGSFVEQAPPWPPFFEVDSAAAADLDGDGDLDLAVAQRTAYGSVPSCAVDGYSLVCGEGTLHRVDFLENTGVAFTVRFTSPEGTGVPSTMHAHRGDVFVTSDPGRNEQFRCVNWTCTNVLPPLDPANHGMGVAFADFDGDGSEDAYFADLGTSQLWMKGVDEGERLLPMTRFTSAWSPIAADFNGDGWTDVYVANLLVGRVTSDLEAVALNQPYPPFPPQVDFLLENRGGTFAVHEIPHHGTGVAISHGEARAADFDGDGRLDVAVARQGYPPEFQLLHNETR